MRWPLVLAFVLLASCRGEDRDPSIEAEATVNVSSSAFADGDEMPVEFTCEGDDVSPPLEWSGADDASSFVVTMVDPDAPGGTFVHWVLYGIPGSVTSLDKGAAPQGASFGRNDFGNESYGGPCPPPGDEAHRYVTTVYAVSGQVEVDAGASLDDVLGAIEEGVVAKGSITTTFARS